MDSGFIEWLRKEVQSSLQNAAELELVPKLRDAFERTTALLERLQSGGAPSSQELADLQKVLRFYQQRGRAPKERKKIDLKGQSAGGSEHKSKKRPSSRERHQKGRTTVRKSYSGEKADESRRYPRRKPKGWKQPWPPPEDPKK